jgi:hypothetical protein
MLRTAAASDSVMLRFGLRCVLTYYQYAPRAPRPKPRPTKSEIAAVRSIGRPYLFGGIGIGVVSAEGRTTVD